MKVFLYLSLAFVFFSTPVANSLVLDWSGRYEVEINTLQNSDLERWTHGEAFHNLHLKPDLKAFDQVRVRSWLQFAPQTASTSTGKYVSQEGIHWGLHKEAPLELPLLAVRDLYLEVEHAFGVFQAGWKPYHFGLGMFYNNAEKAFSPYYNLESTRGFVSWRGAIGSSYYIQPRIHYLSDTSFNIFFQGGWKRDKYGVELVYKIEGNLSEEAQASTVEKSPNYLGVYAYYKQDRFSIETELGFSGDLYGVVLDLKWHTPLSWLALHFDAGHASRNTVPDVTQYFYFDPNFSSHLSFLIEEYETIKPIESREIVTDTGSETIPATTNFAGPKYAFTGVYLSPSAYFSISNSLTLISTVSVHSSVSLLHKFLTHGELTLSYQLAEGLVWNTGIGALSPPRDDNWYIGAISQAAITF